MAVYPDVPKLKVPFQIVGNQAAVIEQDSDDEIYQCVLAICRTPEGTRIDEAEFGIPDFTFKGEIDADLIQDAISEWEPRAEDSIDVGAIIDRVAKATVNVKNLEDPNV